MRSGWCSRWLKLTISSAIGDALLPLAPTPRQPPPLRKSALGSGSRRWWTDRSRSHSHQRRKRCVAHRASQILRGRATDKRHPYLLKQHPYVPAAHHPQHVSSPSSCAPSTEAASPNPNVLLSCSQLHLYYRSRASFRRHLHPSTAGIARDSVQGADLHSDDKEGTYFDRERAFHNRRDRTPHSTVAALTDQRRVRADCSSPSN
ncbi:hypothetical protein B0H13DRAFT_2063363 [Mycena leptocephala]|nr:hypothetical protein B0H13DRAFT_2063363 [Mycena leptocephala]